MKTSRSVIALAALSLILTGSFLLGCSKSSSPTNPYGGGTMGGGGGGGGGTGGGGGGAGGTVFNSGTLTAPATFVHTFATAGNVGYHCNFHVDMGMIGTVTVADGAADSAVVTAAGVSFTPAAVTIRPGGFVRWNVTGGTHTVTSNN